MRESGIKVHIDQYILQNIPDAFCLGVYCYIKSLPNNSKITKEDVASNFGISLRKARSVFSKLHKFNLIDYVVKRNKDGTIFEVETILV